MSATATLYLQPLSTASVSSSIASKASETLSRALVAWISQKKTIFSRASCTASCPSLTAYQTLSSLTSPFPTISQQLWLYMHPVSLSASVASYFNSFMIFFSSFGIFNIIPSFVISFRNCISTNIALSIILRLYDVNYFSAKIKI